MPVMPLLDRFTRNRWLTISIAGGLFALSIAVSATRSNCVSEFMLAYLGDWSAALSALAALVLLYVVYMTLLKTGEMRREDRESEFKRRQLDEILDWAQEVNRALLVPGSSSGILGVHALADSLEKAAVGSDWTAMIAKIFGEDIRRCVTQVAADVQGYIEALYINQTPATARDALSKSLLNLLEAIYKTKTEQKL